MKIIAVDDERLALESLTSLLAKMLPTVKTVGFTETSKAINYLKENSMDIAFLDIELGEINGLYLAKEFKEICPDINIIFVTGYAQYSLDALKLHASGYLLKPVRSSDIELEIKNLRNPVPLTCTNRVRIQTFGNFEIFLDDKPLYIPLRKCRECLAYLVDRKGALVTVAELGAVLWEDKPYDRKVQNNTYRVISDLVKYLKKTGISDIILKYRKGMAINREKIDCDYYHFLKGDVAYINTFRGEYMTNYSWAEFTLASLAEHKPKQNAPISQHICHE